jgi:hypothetical protein
MQPHLVRRTKRARWLIDRSNSFQRLAFFVEIGLASQPHRAGRLNSATLRFRLRCAGERMTRLTQRGRTEGRQRPRIRRKLRLRCELAPASGECFQEICWPALS